MWVPYSNRVQIPGLPNDDDDDDSGGDSDYDHEEEEDEQQPLQNQEDEQHDDDDEQQPPLQYQDDHDEQPALQHQDQPHDQEVLRDGVEVKLQRNALSAPEHPAGSEVDEDNDLVSSRGSDICEKDHDFFSGSVQPARPLVPSATDVQSTIHPRLPKVNLAALSGESLSRYCKRYKIAGIDSDSSREDMLNAVEHHFATQPPLEEKQVLDNFLAHHRRDKNSPTGKHSDNA